jgi:hypothetical protein
MNLEMQKLTAPGITANPDWAAWEAQMNAPVQAPAPKFGPPSPPPGMVQKTAPNLKGWDEPEEYELPEFTPEQEAAWQKLYNEPY